MKKSLEYLIGVGTAAILYSDIVQPEHHHFHNHIDMKREMINPIQGVDVYGIGRKLFIPKRTLVGFPTSEITIFEIPTQEKLLK